MGVVTILHLSITAAVPGYLVKEIWMIRAENVVTGPLEIFEKARRIYKTDLIMAFVCFSCRLRWGGEVTCLNLDAARPDFDMICFNEPGTKNVFCKTWKEYLRPVTIRHTFTRHLIPLERILQPHAFKSVTDYCNSMSWYSYYVARSHWKLAFF